MSLGAQDGDIKGAWFARRAVRPGAWWRAVELVRFCNNPTCERCDEYLGPREVLLNGTEEVCSRCLETLVVQPRRRRFSTEARRAMPDRRA